MMEVGMLHEAHFSIAVQSLEYVSCMMQDFQDFHY